MKIPVEVMVDVDAWAWAQRFGLAANAVEFDVQEYFAGLVRRELRELELDIPLDPGATSGVREFRGDDAGYLAWLDANPGGYVINIRRSYNAIDARVHRASCWTIKGRHLGGKELTGPYVKVCAEHRDDLVGWLQRFEASILSCGTCHPDQHAAQSNSIEQTEPASEVMVPDARYEIRGPAAGSAVVEAWADDYIRFERRPDWQELLRTEIRTCCQQLEPSAEQVLHATFFGVKHHNADVENVVLYNIDSFKVPGRNGIRFEHRDAVPLAPDGAAFRFCYRYALTPRSEPFTDGRQGRTLASFDWTDLGTFAGEKKLAQVWLSLARARYEGKVKVSELAAETGTPFAVRVQVRPPLERQPVLGGLVKGIFDGVICAFQAHTDAAVLPDVLARLAQDLPAPPAEIEEHLLDVRRAVLGPVEKLVSPHGAGVKWNPSDHMCIAGELLPAEPVDERWAIKGDIIELSR